MSHLEPSNPDRPTRRGFTLVEMIITIGIIGLLLGLTFPALRTFQRQAQNVQCLSNLAPFSNFFLENQALAA